jgi:hypothetical protein
MSTGDRNVLIGHNCFYGIGTSGSNNVAFQFMEQGQGYKYQKQKKKLWDI